MKCSNCGSEKVVENVTPEIMLFCKTCGNIEKNHIHKFYPVKLLTDVHNVMWMCECGTVKYVEAKE